MLTDQIKLVATIIVISILLTTTVILGLYSRSKSNQLEIAKSSLEQCNLLKANEESNNITLSAVIEDLNNEKLKEVIDIEARDKEYKTQILKLTKEVRKVGSNECEDIKIKLDSYRGTDYTRLLK